MLLPHEKDSEFEYDKVLLNSKHKYFIYTWNCVFERKSKNLNVFQLGGVG